jgi:hypothetical protein
MFPGAYWFLCKKTLETMYVVGTYGPYLIKKITDKKSNELESTTGESNPEDENGIQHTKLS